MVISFSSEKARNYLLENKRIFTFRSNRRKQFIKLEEQRGHTLIGLWDWMNEGRCKPKIKDVIIFEVGHFMFKEIEPWVPWSGFDSLAEWSKELIDLHDWDGFGSMDMIDGGWLYMVDWEYADILTKSEVNEK